MIFNLKNMSIVPQHTIDRWCISMRKFSFDLRLELEFNKKQAVFLRQDTNVSSWWCCEAGVTIDWAKDLRGHHHLSCAIIDSKKHFKLNFICIHSTCLVILYRKPHSVARTERPSLCLGVKTFIFTSVEFKVSHFIAKKTNFYRL